MSVLRAGRGRGRGGGGGGWKFLVTEKNNSLRNVPGVLKRKKKKFGEGGKIFQSFFSLLKFFLFKNVPGGDFGVFGAPHAPTRGSRGVGKRYTSSYDHDL